MIGPRSRRTLVGVILGLAASGAAAATLYATNLRVFAAAGHDNVVGSLYKVDLGDATAKLVAPVRLKGSTEVGITGLSAHPVTGVFYGITSVLSPASPRSLVTLDVDTGEANVIGTLGAAGSDIAFSADGALFVWLPATSQIGIVDLATAAVVPLGTPGPPASGSSGLAIDGLGTAYVTPGGASGRLDRVDTRTGKIEHGPLLIGAPFPTAITAMTFSPSGLLLAVNSNEGSPAAVRLVAINTATGAVSPIGTLPDNTDAIAFGSGPRDIRLVLDTLSGRTLALFSVILCLVLAAVVTGVITLRKRR